MKKDPVRWPMDEWPVVLLPNSQTGAKPGLRAGQPVLGLTHQFFERDVDILIHHIIFGFISDSFHISVLKAS